MNPPFPAPKYQSKHHGFSTSRSVRSDRLEVSARADHAYRSEWSPAESDPFSEWEFVPRLAPGNRSRFIFDNGVPTTPQRYRESVGQGRLRGHRRKVHAKMDDGLGDLGTDAADETV